MLLIPVLWPNLNSCQVFNSRNIFSLWFFSCNLFPFNIKMGDNDVA